MSNLEIRQSGDFVESGGPSLLTTLLRHKILFLSVFLVGFTLTMLYVFVSPKKYESDMSLLVRNERKPQVLSSEATLGGSSIVSDVTEGQLYSEVEILGSADVLDEVIEPGWNNIPVTTRPQAQVAAHQVKVDKLRKHLTIEAVKKSHVIDVSYIANDPVDANKTLNRVLKAYLIHEAAVTSESGASSFFSNEARRYKQEWNAAQEKLATFQQTHHLTAIQDKETELATATAEASTLKRAADAEQAEVSHKVLSEQQQLAATSKREIRTQRVMPATGSLDQLNTLRTQLMVRRSQLLTAYQPNDPLVKQVDAQIAQANAELSKSQAMNTTEESTDVSPKWQALDQELADDRSRLSAVSARGSAIGGQIGVLQGQMKQIEADAAVFNTLQQEVATAFANYQLYVQKRDATGTSEAMNAGGLINIGVSQAPTFALGQVRPRTLIDTVLGLATTLLLSWFVVYRAEASRRTVSNLSELQNVSKYPALAAFALGPTGPGEHSISGKKPEVIYPTTAA